MKNKVFTTSGLGVLLAFLFVHSIAAQGAAQFNARRTSDKVRLVDSGIDPGQHPVNLGYSPGIGFTAVSTGFLPLVFDDWPLVIFFDDFGDPNSGWFIEDTPDTKWSYVGGEYELLLKNPFWWAGATAPIFGGLTQYTVEADVRRVSGVESAYGLIFDFVDWDHHYLFLVSPNGKFFSVWRKEVGWEPVVDWKTSPHINSGTVSNHLKVERNGSAIAVSVNGQLLATGFDSTYMGNFVLGLYSQSGNSAPAAVRFDDFTVRSTLNGSGPIEGFFLPSTGNDSGREGQSPALP